MNSSTYPLLYQVNTRPFLTDLARRLGRIATLDDIPDETLDRWGELGFEWIWMLSVWQTGSASREVSRTNPEWRAGFQKTLPDLTDDDIPGSGFAITGYSVHQPLGGNAALGRLRKRLAQRGLKLMLGCMVETSVGITAAAHIAPLFDHIDLDGHVLINNDPFIGCGWDNGRLTLSQAPGLGVRLREGVSL